ncbi:MAG: PIN domain-containing protein [Nanoarchaeota archaeon]|nr:PIN domain-containing protein [Nanoarchaeota archaeon]
MKFVVDANVMFALSKPSSAANSILSRHKLKLIAPDFALLELYKYRKQLTEKSGIGSFDEIIKSLKHKVVFVDKGEYEGLLKKAISSLPNPDDAAYLALALRLFLPIWSNDPHLKGQSTVPVFTTAELIKLLG